MKSFIQHHSAFHQYVVQVLKKGRVHHHRHQSTLPPLPPQPKTKLFSEPSSSTFPTQAEIVICGSGIMGNSVAYHLVNQGKTDMVILQLPGHTQNSRGTASSNIGGPISLFKGAYHEEEIIRRSITLYKKLEDQGFEIGLQANGGLYLAQEAEMMTEFRRRVDLFEATSDIHMEILTPQQIQKRFPLININGLKGGVLVHEDVVANPSQISAALASLAVAGGAKIVPDCHFKKVLVKNGRVCGVETKNGTIKCDYFVNCSGWFAWEYGQKQNPPVRIPVHPAERHYLKTKPSSQPLPLVLPTITDMNSYIYTSKLVDNSFVIGAHEKFAKPIFTNGVPASWLTEMVPCWDHMFPILGAAIERFPILSGLERDQFTSEPDTFSPDGLPIIGEAAEIKNYFVAAATNGSPMQIAGGFGEYLAHWIIHGERHAPLLKVDILRFVDVHNCRHFLRDRVSEIVSKQCEIRYPNVTQYSTARNIRCSPLHSILHDSGGVFGENMCFERAAYFDKPRSLSDEGEHSLETTFRKPPFFEQLKAEYAACTQAVAVSDISSYCKFTLNSSSKDKIVPYLQKICSNNVDIPVGQLIPTGMQNKHGGYEVDCILGRLSDNRYFIWCPPNLESRAPDWMKRNLPSDNSIEIHDTTSKYSMIEIIGPKSTDVVSHLAHRDMKMPLLRFQIVSFSHAPQVNVTTFTATATRGYSLCIPSEYALHVYKKLMHVGKIYGIRNVGYYIHRSLRMEKNIGYWGDEIHGFSTPKEVGRMHRVDLNKDFIGKEAILDQLENGVTQRLTYFTLRPDEEEYSIHKDIWPWSGEPIYRNGLFVGRATSTSYGFTKKIMMVFSFITTPNKERLTTEQMSKYILDKSALYQIVLAGQRFKLYPSLTLTIKNTSK